MGKYYLLYNNDEQSKLFTTASSVEKLESETEYYSDGVWFEYDQVENSNHLTNEKKMKGIKFPAEPKTRNSKDFGEVKKKAFNWVA